MSCDLGRPLNLVHIPERTLLSPLSIHGLALFTLDSGIIVHTDASEYVQWLTKRVATMAEQLAQVSTRNAGPQKLENAATANTSQLSSTSVEEDSKSARHLLKSSLSSHTFPELPKMRSSPPSSHSQSFADNISQEFSSSLLDRKRPRKPTTLRDSLKEQCIKSESPKSTQGIPKMRVKRELSSHSREQRPTSLATETSPIVTSQKKEQQRHVQYVQGPHVRQSNTVSAARSCIDIERTKSETVIRTKSLNGSDLATAYQHSSACDKNGNAFTANPVPALDYTPLPPTLQFPKPPSLASFVPRAVSDTTEKRTSKQFEAPRGRSSGKIVIPQIFGGQAAATPTIRIRKSVEHDDLGIAGLVYVESPPPPSDSNGDSGDQSMTSILDQKILAADTRMSSEAQRLKDSKSSSHASILPSSWTSRASLKLDRGSLNDAPRLDSPRKDLSATVPRIEKMELVHDTLKQIKPKRSREGAPEDRVVPRSPSPMVLSRTAGTSRRARSVAADAASRTYSFCTASVRSTDGKHSSERVVDGKGSRGSISYSVCSRRSSTLPDPSALQKKYSYQGQFMPSYDARGSRGSRKEEKKSRRSTKGKNGDLEWGFEPDCDDSNSLSRTASASAAYPPFNSQSGLNTRSNIRGATKAKDPCEVSFKESKRKRLASLFRLRPGRAPYQPV